FDQRLIEGARRAGAQVHFGVSVTGFHPHPQRPRLQLEDEQGRRHDLNARFVLDASGYGRVLARLEKLDQPSSLAPRTALFTHVEDHIETTEYDREKILIGIHPQDAKTWYWLIPFHSGRASVGVVTAPDRADAAGDSDDQRLWNLLHQE